MTQSRPKKTVSVLLSLALLLSLLGTGVHAAGTAVAQGAYADVYNMISDPDASDASAYFSPSTIENGRLWTDKTVSVGSAPIYDMNGNPLKTLTAPQDQFMVNLSVLSQSYTVDTIVEPSDTVFVLDVSGSMTTVMDNGKTRIEETVAALNTAIGILLDANPDNRVAVVAYGGLQVGTAWQTRTYDILDLDRYDMVTDGNYFYMSAANVVSVSSQITAPTTRSVTVTGGTPTQRGIYAGAQVLMNNGDTAFTTVYPNNPANPLTMTRKPNIILLSDGEPTYGWTDYTMRSPANPNSSWNWGNGSALDLGIDTLTVCTAAYWKQQVSDHYYGTANGGYAGFYTLGLALNSNHALAVLDPLNNARYVTQLYNSVTYNMGAVLGSFVGPAATATFPAVNTNGTSRTSVTITNPGNYISEYAYTDGFYSAQNAAQLESAFKTIAQRIVSRGDYITHVPPNENPDFSGYVNYSDVIGSYMQFKGVQGLWYENNLYDGHVFARDIRTDPALQNEYINDLIKNGLFNLSSTQARSLLTSAIAAGAPDGIFYNSPTDFGNKIKYYGDDSGSYLGSYFDASGNALPAPAGATCIVDLYAMAGKVDNTDPVTTPPTDPTDLMTISFQVITALAAGNFFDNFYDADTSTTGNEFVRSLQTGQQVVRWLIPASLIPLRTISPELDENGSVLRLDIKNTDPMRFIYNVGLQSGFDLSGVDAAYKAANTANTTPAAYSFYTNAWNKGPDSSNLAVAYFQPKATNPYYFYTSADGQVPLYVQDGSGGFTPAVTYVSGTTYYTKDEVFDADYAPTYLRDIFTPVDESVTTISGQDGAPFIDVSGANQQVKPAAFVTELKSPNITETTPYVLNGYAYMPAGIDQYSQINLLGNNGRLDIPFTQLTARKDWDQSIADPQPVYIQLYGTDLNGVPQPVGDPVKFDPSATGTAGLSASAAYTWSDLPLYTLDMDGEGNVHFIDYTVEEGAWDGVTFTPDSGNGPFEISYTQPVWNNTQGVWSDAVVNNAVNPPPPPPTGWVSLTAEKLANGGALSAGQFTFAVIDAGGGTVATGSNAADGSITFSTINYTAADVGVHNYTIIETGQSGGGWTLSGSVFPVTVTVAANGNGSLTATPEYIDGPAVFINTYRQGQAGGSVTLTAEKRAVGGTLSAGQFFFAVRDAAGTTVATGTNAADGGIIFSAINYTTVDAGTHGYTIVETSQGGGGWTTDGRVYNVSVSVSDNGDGTLRVIAAYPDGPAVFTDTYQPNQAGSSVTLTAEKRAVGGALSAGQFTFAVRDTNGATVATGSNMADGTITFTTIYYTAADVGGHDYTIAETSQDGGGWTTDGRVYNVSVSVSDNGDGTLRVTASYPDGPAVFTDTYQPNQAGGSVTLTAEKRAVGGALSAGQFTFAVRDTNGATVATGSNMADGTIIFTTIYYTAADVGGHDYTIAETSQGGRGWTTDGRVYNVSVSVSDNGDGTLTAAPVYPDGGVVFVNTYTTPGLASSLSITKSLTPSQSPYVRIGDTVHYVITVANTGQTVLTDVTVTDPLGGLKRNIGSLDIGKSETFNIYYIVKQADVTDGEVTNTAAAVSDQTATQTDEAVVYIIPPGQPDTGDGSLLVLAAVLLSALLLILALNLKKRRGKS